MAPKPDASSDAKCQEWARARLPPCISISWMHALSENSSLFSSHLSARAYLVSEDSSETMVFADGRLCLTTPPPVGLRIGREFLEPFQSLRFNLFIMFSLLQRDLGEESVLVVVLSCASVVLGVATVALFWRVVVRPHRLLVNCSPVSCLLDAVMITCLLIARLASRHRVLRA